MIEGWLINAAFLAYAADEMLISNPAASNRRRYFFTGYPFRLAGGENVMCHHVVEGNAQYHVEGESYGEAYRDINCSFCFR